MPVAEVAEVAEPERTTTRPRLTGVDVTRGLALLGMMAVHAAGALTEEGTPTAANAIAGGRSAATFAFVAGISLAFLSGGRTALQGHRRTAAASGIAVRGLLIIMIGLLLGYLDAADVILPFYGVMFLLAIPLLRLPPRWLALLAAAFAVLGPILLVATAGRGLPYEGLDLSPTLTTVVQDPIGMLAVLFLTGEYPIVAYLAYVCAGMAVGRLDLSSRRTGTWLLGGGLAAAVLAELGSAVLLYPFGGLDRLAATTAANDGVAVTTQLLWEPAQGSSWWYLALASPHANTPFDLVHTLGVAMAVLGAALLLTRLPVASRVLRPVADAGTMTLTLYCAHLFLLTTGVLEDDPPALFILMAVASVGFAVLWRPRFGQGPLERRVTRAADRTRRAVANRLAGRTGGVTGGMLVSADAPGARSEL